jgi:hypothetical protein
MANFSPLGYTGRILASTTQAGVCQFDPANFTVDIDGIVSLLGTGTVETINSLSPVAGNFILAGTTNQITATSAGHTVTFSIPSAFTAPGSVTTTTSLTSGTGITATTGNIAATAGNVTAGAAISATTTITAGTGLTITTGDTTASAGNVIINGAAKGLRVHGGAVTDFIGTATLASGTVTIANTNISSSDRIMISRRSVNGSTTLGVLTYSISASTSFTITAAILGTPGSTQTADTSIVDYFIVRQV